MADEARGVRARAGRQIGAKLHGGRTLAPEREAKRSAPRCRRLGRLLRRPYPPPPPPGRVGKTSILLRFMKNAFSDREASTLSASCFDKTVSIGGGETARMSVWDTAGQERFHALGPLYYRDAGE